MRQQKDRVLLIAGTGFLGSHLQKTLTERIPIFGYTSRTLPPGDVNHFALDLQKSIEPQLAPIFSQKEYTHIILSAAISDPNQCFQHPELSRLVNVTATMKIANLAKQIGAQVIFFSSDLVFGGKKDFCTETEPTCPTTLYGRQKVEAEEYISGICSRNVIFRVSKLLSCEPHPRNMLNPILEGLLRGKLAKLFTDQYTTPLFIEDISDAICLVIEQKLHGIYHLGMAEKFSRYEVGLHLAELLQLSAKNLVPFQMKDFAFPEERGPTNTIVSRKFEQETGFLFHNFKGFLPKLKENLSRF